jgi:hypothetical protein
MINVQSQNTAPQAVRSEHNQITLPIETPDLKGVYALAIKFKINLKLYVSPSGILTETS